MWPESATPFFFEEHPAAEAMRLLARETGARLFVGSDQIERARQPRYYNSAFLIQPTGSVGGVYRKMHLVPFGEYVPLESILSFAGPLVEQVGGFAPGETLTVFRVREGTFTTGICYEAVFPELSREAVLRGSQLLTYDHQRRLVRPQLGAVAALRAWPGCASVETGPLPGPRRQHRHQRHRRSRTAGWSSRRALFEETVAVGEVRFLDGTTPYVRIGDVVPWAGLVVAIGLLGPERARPAPSRVRLAAPVRRSACRPSIVKSSSAATKTS